MGNIPQRKCHHRRRTGEGQNSRDPGKYRLHPREYRAHECQDQAEFPGRREKGPGTPDGNEGSAAANLASDSVRAKMGAAASWFCIIVLYLERGGPLAQDWSCLAARPHFSFGDGVNRIFVFDINRLKTIDSKQRGPRIKQHECRVWSWHNGPSCLYEND